MHGNFYFDENGTPLPQRTHEAAFAVRVEAAPDIPLPGDAAGCLRRIRLSMTDARRQSPFEDPRRLQVRQLARSDVTHDLATWQKLQVGPIFTAILQLTHCIRLMQSELHILEWRHQLARLHTQFYLKSLSHA